MFSLIYAFIKGVESFFGLIFLVAVVVVFINITGLCEKLPEPKENQKIEKFEKVSESRAETGVLNNR